MADPTHVLWADVEADGARDDPAQDSILEVGCILTDLDCNEVARFETLVLPRAGEDWRDHAEPEALKLHLQSRLAEELDETMHLLPSTQVVDIRLDERLYEWHDIIGDRLILAGSGVSHFDRPRINIWLPRLSEWLVYWSWDVGVVRRFLRTVDPSLVYPLPEGGKKHRALADAEDHLSEWQHYRQLIKEML